MTNKILHLKFPKRFELILLNKTEKLSKEKLPFKRSLKDPSLFGLEKEVSEIFDGWGDGMRSPSL